MLQVVLSGLASGAIYGLVGMGFAIAFYVDQHDQLRGGADSSWSA